MEDKHETLLKQGLDETLLTLGVERKVKVKHEKQTKGKDKCKCVRER